MERIKSGCAHSNVSALQRAWKQKLNGQQSEVLKLKCLCTGNCTHQNKDFYEKGKLFHGAVPCICDREKQIWEKQTLFLGRRRAGRSDGDLWEARAPLEGQEGWRQYPAAKAGFYMWQINWAPRRQFFTPESRDVITGVLRKKPPCPKM